MSSLPVKILLCETEEGTANKLSKMMDVLPGNFILNESDAEKIKRNIAILRPDVLLTDNKFWLRDDATDVINSIRTTETLPIVVWASAMNKKILSSVFKGANIHFVRQTDEAALLVETLSKSLIPYQ